MSPGLFTDPVDPAAIFGQGVQFTRLSPPWPRVLLRQVQAVDMRADPTLSGVANAHHRQRAIWQEDPQPAAAPLEAFGQRLLEGPLAALLAPYRSARVQDARCLLYACAKGYQIDWHDHLDFPSVVRVLIYLSPDALGAQDGAHLQVARVTRDPQTGQVMARDILVNQPTDHGLVALLDSQTPLFQHRATELLADKARYVLNYSIASFFADNDDGRGNDRRWGDPDPS